VHDNSEVIGQVVGVVIMALIGFGVWWSLRGGKLKLVPGEQRIAYIYANCPQHRFGGLIVAGSASDGKLILTNQRLLFCSPNEGKVGFYVAPAQITAAVKGTNGPMMTLDLTYQNAKGKPKRVIFTQVAAIPTLAIDPAREMPIGMFIDKVEAWRRGAAA
jgi:hypothetical protein